MLVLQFPPGEKNLKIVYPLAVPGAASIRFPTPAWGKRRCVAVGSGTLYGAPAPNELPDSECSGHGSCEYSHVEAGHEVYQCVCSSQYTGQNCAEESWFLVVLLVALAGAIVLGIGICSWWRRIKRLRERTYTTFISHAKSDGGDTAAHLCEQFDRELLSPFSTRGKNFLVSEPNSAAQPSC